MTRNPISPIVVSVMRLQIFNIKVIYTNKNNLKAWLYLLPAILFLGVFMVYPLIDVFIYSFELGKYIPVRTDGVLYI